MVLIRFSDTFHLSHTTASKSSSSEQIPKTGIIVASSIKEVKKQVVMEDTKIPVVEADSQESENKTLEGAMLQGGNGNELHASCTGPTLSGSAEQTLNRVIDAAYKIQEITQAVAPETPITMAESVKKSVTSQEKTIVHKGSDTSCTDVDNIEQELNKGLLSSNELEADFLHHEEGGGDVASNAIADVASNAPNPVNKVMSSSLHS